MKTQSSLKFSILFFIVALGLSAYSLMNPIVYEFNYESNRLNAYGPFFHEHWSFPFAYGLILLHLFFCINGFIRLKNRKIHHLVSLALLVSSIFFLVLLFFLPSEPDRNQYLHISTFGIFTLGQLSFLIFENFQSKIINHKNQNALDTYSNEEKIKAYQVINNKVKWLILVGSLITFCSFFLPLAHQCLGTYDSSDGTPNSYIVSGLELLPILMIQIIFTVLLCFLANFSKRFIWLICLTLIWMLVFFALIVFLSLDGLGGPCLGSVTPYFGVFVGGQLVLIISCYYMVSRNKYNW
jgi:hypothetical protein